MDDLRNSAPVDTTVILSKDLGVQDPFSDMQVTIAELGTDAPTVSLYRFINAEETAYMELNGLEMIKLIDAYTTKHIFSAPHHVDIASALHRAKNRIERLTDKRRWISLGGQRRVPAERCEPNSRAPPEEDLHW